MPEITMKEILSYLALAGFKAKSHYDAVRMFDALMKPRGLTVRISKVVNKPSHKARLTKVSRNSLIVEKVVVYTT